MYIYDKEQSLLTPLLVMLGFFLFVSIIFHLLPSGDSEVTNPNGEIIQITTVVEEIKE